MLVPLDEKYATSLLVVVEYSKTPLAAMSGLMRPSSVGPQLLKAVTETLLLPE